MNRMPFPLESEAEAERFTSGFSLNAPKTLAETGIDEDALSDLGMRILFRRGRCMLRDFAAAMCLPPSVAGEVLASLRHRQFVELVSHTGMEIEANYQLTAAGHQFALEAFNRCRYVGPAPVSLRDYCAQVSNHSMRHVPINAAYVHKAFQGKVIDPVVLDQMGAAMNSGRAVLVFGPAGSGKTYLAEQLAALQPGCIPVPHAVTVGGEIIQMFDPLIHEPVSSGEKDNLVRSNRDQRWQWCRRPVVVAGGELTLQMLDLQFDPATRYYQAPPHLKANGGIFVVDDLGRQLVSARDLMNRWIVPLDRCQDYLSLHTGFKFAVPFEMSVMFLTNLRPVDIADEAFLRRFGYKIYLGPMDIDSYRQVFVDSCRKQGVEFDKTGFEWLIEHRHRKEQRQLLACYPRDLIGRVSDFAIYHDRPAIATADALAMAWATYFTANGALATDDFDKVTTGGGMR